MKLRVVADTSALVSLGCGDVLAISKPFFQYLIPPRVEAELKEMAKRDDSFGKAAQVALASSHVIVHSVQHTDKRGEVEAVHLANQLGDVDAVLMDDVPASKQLAATCTVPIFFSPVVVHTLCEQGCITKSKGWNIVGKMAAERTWKDNVIFETARLLWEK